MERWLPVPGYEGVYEVSDQGRVRSLDRITTHGRRRKGMVLIPSATDKGYLHVGLHLGGSHDRYFIHRLVLRAFEGEAPAGHEARHLNGVPPDNALSNLAWGTHLENMRDQREHGTHRNSLKTECPLGHPYSGENLMVDREGHRRCAKCRRESWRRVSARRTAERMTA